jgi:hypothetical protein
LGFDDSFLHVVWSVLVAAIVLAIDFMANETIKIALMVELFVKGSKNVLFSDIKRPNSPDSLKMKEVGIGGSGIHPLSYWAATAPVTP